MRYAVPVLGLLVLLVFLGIGLKLDPRKVPSPLIGKAAPAFDLPVLDSPQKNLSSDDLRGRPVLVNFFASWCSGCRIEHPLLLKLADQGVEIVGIDYKDNPADGSRWLKRNGNPFRQVAVDHSGAVGLNYGVYGIPETFLLSADGTIIYKQIGPMTLEDWEEKIRPLMQSGDKG